jgi:hypothetical protein
MDNKFFTFIKPCLSYIDSGKFFRQPFGWLYAAIAVANLLAPFYALIRLIGFAKYVEAKIIMSFTLIWLAIVFTSWVCFQLWWDRKSKVTAIVESGDEFTATPVFSHFIQTLGEWAGVWIGVAGFLVALFSTLFGSAMSDDLSFIGLPFLKTGFFAIVTMPVCGFLTVVATRFFAERLRALPAIASNTKKRKQIED